MRAVNLVPLEERRGGGPARSGSVVYLLLGALGLALVLVVTATLAGRQVTGREADVVAAEAEAARAEARVGVSAGVEELAKATGERVTRIRTLAAGRVRWSHALSDVAGAVGDEVHFEAVTATSSPTTASGGSALRAALTVPAIEVKGCARDNAAVARLMARLRATEATQRVSLATTDRGEEQPPESSGSGAAPTTTATGAADCSRETSRPARFTLIVFLDPPGAADGAAAGTTPAAGAPAPAATTTTGATP
jgi:Tfp pilus assembly protein PilN